MLSGTAGTFYIYTNGGKVNGSSDEYVSVSTDGTEGSNLYLDTSKLTLTPPSGMVFNGWYYNTTSGECASRSQVARLLGIDGAIFAIAWSNPSASEVDTVYVTFNKAASDATGTMSEQALNIAESGKLTKCAFALANYAFAGWDTDEDANTVVFADQASVSSISYTMTYPTDKTVGGELVYPDGKAVTTLYAVWRKLYFYYVAFNANGGVGTMASVTNVCDVSTALTSNAFTRVGYEFTGWAKSADGEVEYSDGAAVTNLANAGKSVTLYAKWSPITYTVAFLAPGYDAVTQPATYDVGFALKSNGFVRTGYAFTGWNLESDGSGRAFTDGEIVSNLTAVAGGTVSLHSQWSPIEYKIAFDANGGTGVMEPVNCRYDTAYQLTSNAYTRLGCTFAGWSNKSGGAVVYADGAAVSNLCSVSGSEYKLYAVWNFALGDLNEALDCNDLVIACEDRFSDLIDKIDEPGVGAYDDDYVKICSTRDATKPEFTAVIPSSGRLSFRFSSKNKGKAFECADCYLLVLTNGTEYSRFAVTNMSDGVWTETALTFNNAAEVGFRFACGDQAFDTLYVCLDRFIWIADDDPEPTEEDAPVISGAAAVENGKFRITFTADSRFRYELWKTDSLAAPIVWTSFSPELVLEPDTDGEVSFEPTIDSSALQTFYRIGVQSRSEGKTE